MLWRIWRWRLEASTTSMSMMPIVPTPAAARYRAAGERSPPAPSSSGIGEGALGVLVGLPDVEDDRAGPGRRVGRLGRVDLADLSPGLRQQLAEGGHGDQSKPYLRSRHSPLWVPLRDAAALARRVPRP